MTLRKCVAALLLLSSACLAQTAEELIEAGHWKRARTLVERRLHDAPDDANATFLLSQVRNAFGDRTSPLGLAERAIRLDGNVARYHRQLAEVYGVMAMRANVFQEVLLAGKFRKEIDAALKLDARDVQAMRDLLEFYLVAPGIVGGDVGKAETVARQIAAIDPATGFLATARIAEYRKDHAKMEAMVRRASEVRPATYKVLSAAAQFHLADGHRDEAAAETLARAAITVDAGRVPAYCVLAYIYAGSANWAALDAILSAAAQAVPDDAAPYYRAADRMLADHRDPARAERYLRTYLSQESEGNEPPAAEAHWKLGLALHAQGQQAKAIEEWKTAVRLDPESPAARELKRK